MGEAHSRICLAGEDLDWTGGCSILCAINMKIEVKITQIDGERIVIKSNRVNDGYISYLWGNIQCYEPKGDVYDYAITALKVFAKRYIINKGGICINITSEIPMKSGLASSAALLFALFSELTIFYKIKINKMEICRLCYETEYTNLHSQVGMMDYYAVCRCGTILYNDFQNSITSLSNIWSSFRFLLVYCGESSTKLVNKQKLDRYIRRDNDFMIYINKGNRLVENLRDSINRQNSKECIDIISDYERIMDKYLHVVNDKIREVVNILYQEKVLTVKLTGCGLGGYVFAVVNACDGEKIYKNIVRKGYSCILTEALV